MAADCQQCCDLGSVIEFRGSPEVVWAHGKVSVGDSAWEPDNARTKESIMPESHHDKADLVRAS
jgi:hypothetical protein